MNDLTELDSDLQLDTRFTQNINTVEGNSSREHQITMGEEGEGMETVHSYRIFNCFSQQ